MTRAAVLPEGPTMLESGVPNYEVINVTGVLAPAGAPADILEKLNAATLKVLSQPAVRERFAKTGARLLGNTPEEFAQQIRQDRKMWGEVIQSAGIKAE